MSGLYIHGMEMPEDRHIFSLVLKSDGAVIGANDGKVCGKAVELPPHGDLIDVNALKNIAEPVKDHTGRTEIVVQMRYLGRVSTVIPAEEE